MDHKLALEEFLAFKSQVDRLSYSFPINDSQIDAAYDKCQSLLDTLFNLEVHSFRSQLAGIKVKNVGASKPDKITRLRHLVDNIVDDIKVRSKAGQLNPLHSGETNQLTKLVDEYKTALTDVVSENKTLQGQFEEATEQIDQLKQHYDDLDSLFNAEQDEKKQLKKTLQRYKLWMFVLGLIAFTYVNLTYHYLFSIQFNLKAFTAIESIYFIAFIIYHFKQIPKWVITVLGLILIISLAIYLIQQPGWEVQLTSALWALLVGVIVAYIVYVFKWNK